MAIVNESTTDFSYISGVPDSTSDWQEIDFSFVSSGVLLNVASGSLDISMNGKDVHGVFASRTEDYNFPGLRQGKMYFRGTADFKMWAWL